MSKHNNRSIISALSEISEMPVDIVSGGPLFQLYSDRELVIECVKNLEYYDKNKVRIALKSMSVTVQGECLCIRFLSNMNMSVSGYIELISIEHN